MTNSNNKLICGVPAIIKGEGKPLVFLHGFMSCKEAFGAQIEFFSKRYKVVAPDLTGFGENAFMPYPYSLNDYVNEFYALAERLGGRVSVLAHSFGCRIALKALTESNVIRQAVLIGAAGLKPRRNVKYYAKKACYKLLSRRLPQKRLEKIFFSPDYNMLSPVMKQSFKLVTSELFDECIKNVNVPVLAVFGENDDQTPPYFADRIVKNMLRAQKYIMKGCGHFCFADAPREFNLVVNEFLN